MASNPIIRRINPNTKVKIPNGIAKHGFLNLAVAHPRIEVARIKIPNPMKNELPPPLTYFFTSSGRIFSTYSGIPPPAMTPIASVMIPKRPRRREIPPTTFWHVFLVLFEYLHILKNLIIKSIILFD